MCPISDNLPFAEIQMSGQILTSEVQEDKFSIADQMLSMNKEMLLQRVLMDPHFLTLNLLVMGSPVRSSNPPGGESFPSSDSSRRGSSEEGGPTSSPPRDARLWQNYLQPLDDHLKELEELVVHHRQTVILTILLVLMTIGSQHTEQCLKVKDIELTSPIPMGNAAC